MVLKLPVEHLRTYPFLEDPQVHNELLEGETAACRILVDLLQRNMLDVLKWTLLVFVLSGFIDFNLLGEWEDMGVSIRIEARQQLFVGGE